MHPIQITHHGSEPSEALDELIRDRAAELGELCERIHSLRVVVDSPHHHHRQGNRYHVRLELRLPGRDIVVGNEAADRATDEDPYLAVRRAFDSLRRRLTATQVRRTGKQRAQDAPRGSLRR